MITIDNQQYLTGGEAVVYLAKKWNIPSYSTAAFRVLRSRLKQAGKEIKPDIELAANTTLWKPETLDQIEKPDRSKPRGKREKKEETTNEAK